MYPELLLGVEDVSVLALVVSGCQPRVLAAKTYPVCGAVGVMAVSDPCEAKSLVFQDWRLSGGSSSPLWRLFQAASTGALGSSSLVLITLLYVWHKVAAFGHESKTEEKINPKLTEPVTFAVDNCCIHLGTPP